MEISAGIALHGPAMVCSSNELDNKYLEVPQPTARVYEDGEKVVQLPLLDSQCEDVIVQTEISQLRSCTSKQLTKNILWQSKLRRTRWYEPSKVVFVGPESFGQAAMKHVAEVFERRRGRLSYMASRLLCEQKQSV